MRRSSWRYLTFAILTVIATVWTVGASWQVSRDWPVRDALARVDLSREENACSYRAGEDNQARCRDLARIMSRADHATTYFEDGLMVFGPVLPLIVLAWWLLSGSKGGRSDHRRHSYHPPRHHRPSAA
jgi:hypothetical protein